MAEPGTIPSVPVDELFSRPPRLVDTSSINPTIGIKNAKKILVQYSWYKDTALDTLPVPVSTTQRFIVSAYKYRYVFTQVVIKRFTKDYSGNQLSQAGSGFEDSGHSTLRPDPASMEVVKLPPSISASLFVGGLKQWTLKKYSISKAREGDYEMTAVLEAKTEWRAESAYSRKYEIPVITNITEVGKDS